MEKLMDRKTVEDILTKIYDKYPRMAPDEYQEFLDQVDITDSEAITLLANAIYKAIDRISIESDIPDYVATDLKHKHYWIEGWDVSLDTVNRAKAHLEEVCRYHREQHGTEYNQAWLADWEDEFFERVKREYGRPAKRNIKQKFNWSEE